MGVGQVVLARRSVRARPRPVSSPAPHGGRVLRAANPGTAAATGITPLVSTGSGIYEATWLDTSARMVERTVTVAMAGLRCCGCLLPGRPRRAGRGEGAVHAVAVNPTETFSRLGLHHELPKEFAPLAVNDAPVTCDLVTFEAPQLADVH
jgi:hypothetical protein